MSSESLQQLYFEHAGKVSDKWSLYLSEYDQLFCAYRDKPVRFLEIGIQNGGSLEIWAKYFAKATALIGCDINPDCAHLRYEDSRIAVIVGDANSPDVSEQIFQKSSQLDIIIDDGSHMSGDIVKSFAQYFPRIADGGLFVVEDLHCSYWASFDGGLFDPYASISFFKRLADVISHEHWGVPKQRADILRGIFKKYDCEIGEETLSQVHSVHFVNSMCVVKKCQPADNGLGRRIIVGSAAAVVPGVQSRSDALYHLDPAHHQSQNPWSTRKTPPDEEIEYVERILVNAQEYGAELERTIAELNRRNLELVEDAEALRQSVSWRITAPLRYAATHAKRLVNRRGRATVGEELPAEAVVATADGARTTFLATMRNMRSFLLHRGYVFYRRYMRGTRLGRLVGQQVLKRGLINTAELQISSLAHDYPACEDEQETDAARIETGSSVPGFHLSAPLNVELADALAVRPRINVLLPSLRLKHMSGGPNTALLLAALLAEKGEHIRLIACDAPAEGEEAALFPHMDGLLQRPVIRDRFELVDGFDRTEPIAIGVNDLFFATAWWTAQIAKYALQKCVCKSFVYLIQDFEPILHEGSTFQARALETYGLSHIPIINTRLLLDHLVREGAGRYADPAFSEEALWFDPALDRRHYFPDPRNRERRGKKVLLFYARPTVARRNLFELGVVALRQAVAAGAIDKDNWEVWAMGERLPPVALGNGVYLNPLPWMNFDAYAERVRTADLMLSLMLSPHPSYPPLEMAASGKLVVTNSFSVKTRERMSALSPNIIVADPSAESVAMALENAAGRINAGLPSYDPTGAISLPSSWDESLKDVVPVLLQRIHALRVMSSGYESALITGYPSNPKSRYEVYRRARLARRRREGSYFQESGLLSFITSAYDTAPEFLAELASSVFLQDGGMQFEWLILDNGSTRSDTRDALQELARHPNVRLERVERNLGIIGGMRYCLENARSRYVLPLDSDDLIEPDCVHVLTRYIKDNNYPPLLYTDEDKLGDGRFGAPYFKPSWDPVLFLHSCYIAHLCVLDRALGLELGLYSDAAAEGCHDWDSFIRFMDAGYVPVHVPEVLYSWRLHEASTSGNIASKDYIAESHRSTLQRALCHRNAPHLELVSSPLFTNNVDWWYRRKREPRLSCVSLAINSARIEGRVVDSLRPVAVINADSESCVSELGEILATCESELVHIHWNGITFDDDEWRWDAGGLLELFADAVMVGGTLHDGARVIDGPRIFGFGNGFDCPDRGRALSDPGYSAAMYKARSVSAVSSGHCVVRREFLFRAISILLAEKIGVHMLGPWLGALASLENKRVIFSPFMRAKAVVVPEDIASEHDIARFLSRFWSMLPDTRYYSSRLGLDLETAYTPVVSEDRDRHLRGLQRRTLTYADWLDMETRHRALRYVTPANRVTISIVTPVYHGSDLELLEELARAVLAQSEQVLEWLLVVNGPMPSHAMELIRSKADGEWNAIVLAEPETMGIISSLRVGLEAAKGEYVVPVDADDLITPDAMQILAHEAERLDRPDLIYSDEDLLDEGRPTGPYFRSDFDAVLSFENSTIWHLCAMKRESALTADVYGDEAANWCQDWDTVSRIAGSGGRIVHVPEVLYHWRRHKASTTNNAIGDPRSLDSVRSVLERHIASSAAPERFYVANWPEDRGSPELYIARRTDPLPQFVWIGDVVSGQPSACGNDAILMVTTSGIFIDSRHVLLEVTRVFELHPGVGAVGGLVEGAGGLAVDACYMVNPAGVLESPWLGQPTSYAGPYALGKKTQSVATTGNALAFFRISALKQAGAWPLMGTAPLSMLAAQLCGKLAAKGWTIAFSPLVKARAGTVFHGAPPRRRPMDGIPRVSHALVRYGITRAFRS